MSKKTLHVAVDPGKKGAIIAGTSLENFSIYSIPETLQGLIDVVEDIGALPQAVKWNPLWAGYDPNCNIWLYGRDYQEELRR